VGKRNAYVVLMLKPEGKRPLGRPRRRWEDNVKMYQRNRMGGMGWFHVAQDRDLCRSLVNTVMNLLVPRNVWKLLSR
jgi:hypothetical protein